MLPEFELGAYKDLEVEVDEAEVTDADVEKALKDARSAPPLSLPSRDARWPRAISRN